VALSGQNLGFQRVDYSHRARPCALKAAHFPVVGLG